MLIISGVCRHHIRILAHVLPKSTAFDFSIKLPALCLSGKFCLFAFYKTIFWGSMPKDLYEFMNLGSSLLHSAPISTITWLSLFVSNFLAPIILDVTGNMITATLIESWYISYSFWFLQLDFRSFGPFILCCLIFWLLYTFDNLLKAFGNNGTYHLLSSMTFCWDTLGVSFSVMVHLFRKIITANI